MTGDPRYDVVIPTVGRPSLAALLDALGGQEPPLPERIVVVMDRPGPGADLHRVPPAIASRLRKVRGTGMGPAAARNLGWRRCSSPWVVFFDDDVVPQPGWTAGLLEDLGRAGPGVAGVQGRIRVPLPAERRPTDWERNVHGLEGAPWITADMAYRRAVLERVGGFDERFRRAYREDADLALRVRKAGHRLERGRRTTLHPVGPADRWVSVRLQRGNADDVLMRGIHGPGWRAAAGAPRGRFPMHVLATAAGALGVAAMTMGRRGVAALGLGAWAGTTARFAWQRIAPGPRSPGEVATMAATSVAIPPAAVAWRIRGWLQLRRLLRAGGPPARRFPAAVLFDRDGTLVVDVPYNGEPDRVVPAPGARVAVDRLRAAGVRVGVVTNQSGVARRLLTEDQVRAVNRRIDRLLGPLAPWVVCPHGPGERCGCRKPAPGLVVEAARRLGVRPEECVVVGDTGADVGAAMAAGARAILVPNAATRSEEVAAAPEVARDLTEAVDRILGRSS